MHKPQFNSNKKEYTCWGKHILEICLALAISLSRFRLSGVTAAWPPEQAALTKIAQHDFGSHLTEEFKLCSPPQAPDMLISLQTI